jgi:sulfur carrier protein
MRVLINGTQHELPEGSTVADALRAVGVDPARPGIAVAVGPDPSRMQVVRRAEWAQTAVAPDARLELVTAAQGG